MLASFFSWWLARMNELLPPAWRNAASRLRDGIIVDARPDQNTTVSIRRNGQTTPLSLGAAARQAGRQLVLVRPPANCVLIKRHTIPSAPRRQLDELLRHELQRITPFPADKLFWRWDSSTKSGNRARTEVILTMVPRVALGPALSLLDDAGLKADFLEVGPPERPYLLAIGGAAHRGTSAIVTRGLIWGCAGLAIIALLLPLGLQTLEMHQTDAAIAALQPDITQIEALRRSIAAGDAGREILLREMERTGDVLQTLATVTRILPNDTFLTDFSLRERQMTLSGRSASAPRLITGLSADPAIRNTAFAAPVTRIEGATADVFSIKAEIAKPEITKPDPPKPEITK
jgi:general secretion pathway protein L